MTVSEIATVLAWHDALAADDLATLVGLSSDDIEVADAHGARQGHAALRDWAAAADVTAKIGRTFVHDGAVVVELLPRSGTAENPRAAAFRVVHDRVTAIFGHPDLATALRSTEMTEDDEIV